MKSSRSSRKYSQKHRLSHQSKVEWLAMLLIPLLFMFALSAAADQPKYEIKQIKDNVYRFSTGSHHSAFMVTDEGIFVADPISDAAADYLTKELKKRYKQPIKYLAYSHNHPDHALGGYAYEEAGATTIAHEYAAEDIIATKLLTSAPELTFKDDMRVDLGESYVEMHYHGPNNGRGNISFRFMPANVMFVVDWVVIGRMPYKNLPGYDIQGMIHSTEELLAMPEFDVLIGGHADTGKREDVERYLGYLTALYAAVRDGMLQGKSLQQLQEEVRLPEYSDLKMYDEWLVLNIEGVYRTLNDMSYLSRRPDVR